MKRALGSIALALVYVEVLCAMPAAAHPPAAGICADCQLLVGIGGTYHYFGGTDGFVLPLTLVWGEGRFEAGMFRMATAQTYFNKWEQESQTSARPYWGASVSRRWTLVHRSRWRLFFGFGASYKTEEDELSASHWNFASSLGAHVMLPARGAALELCIRHWSDAGLKLPNRGQDFATLTVTWTPVATSWLARK